MVLFAELRALIKQTCDIYTWPVSKGVCILSDNELKNNSSGYNEHFIL